MIKIASPVLIGALLLALGCADDTEPKGPSGGLTTDEDAVTAYVQPAPWKDMTGEQRGEFMQKVVLPEMRTVFQKANPEAEVSCKTCHGENAGEVGFKMPNGLAPLNLGDFPLDKSANEAIAATAVFMKEEVVPAMAGLLDLDVRSMEKPEGFGCFGCHAKEEEQAL